MNAFKPQGIEYICGKNRNIYFKMNKNNTALGKTRYIKYKREFIKLSTFIKEHYNKKTKKHINYEKKPNVTIINNINDIKDKKIRALFKRTFKKNAKIYIYTSKKLKRGGAAFDIDVRRDNDVVVRREPYDQVYKASLASRSRKNSDPYPYELEVQYDAKVDDIISKITELSQNKTHFERINNLEYKVSFKMDGKDVEYYIRPHIDFRDPYKRFIINFYVCIDVSKPFKWIKLPLHLSLFINDMIEKKIREGRIAGNEEYEIAMFNTGHIHITSDDKIENFNIGTYLELKTKSGAASSRGRTHSNGAASSGAASSTHTYLIADSLKKVAHIMTEHGKEIFKDWYYDNTTETETKDKKFTLFAPRNNNWGASPDGQNIELQEDEKENIFDYCFKNLHYIISNIFYILHKQKIVNNGIKSPISDPISVKGTNTEIEYKPQPHPPKINIKYIHRDVNKRKGLIDLDDLNKGKIFSGRSSVRSRSADPRGHSADPRYDRGPHVESPRRRTGWGDRGHSADPRYDRGPHVESPRRRTGWDRRDGRHPVARTGYRHGGTGTTPMRTPTPMPTPMHTPMPTPMPTHIHTHTQTYKNLRYAPYTNIITKEEIARARQDAEENLRNIDAASAARNKGNAYRPFLFTQTPEYDKHINEQIQKEKEKKERYASSAWKLQPSGKQTNADRKKIYEARKYHEDALSDARAQINARTPAENKRLYNEQERNALALETALLSEIENNRLNRVYNNRL
jgi:hypothetical protein